MSESVQARVRFWHDEEGWGVVDSPETPGGCWVHFSAIATQGCRTLTGGRVVSLEWEEARQDGFDYRAVRVVPAGTEPADPPASSPVGGAYQSTLTLTFDDGRPPITLPGDRGGSVTFEFDGGRRISLPGDEEERPGSSG